MKEFDFEKTPIVDIANEILLDGVKRGASDIHFDPYKDGLAIRMRVDGVLYDYAEVPAEYKRNMVSRIKMIASMNIMETRLPQDGAIKSKIGDKDLDLRVSSLPTHNGEKVVLRILDYSKSLQGLETLGFSEVNLQKIIEMTEIPNGIILVTGATGSGKSTTVYSILQKLNTREVNIITVEDPVEMEIEGLNQVQAQQEIGLDFATVLRSILRQDPDIIMIGEIRDTETARIAVRASITGHKVLSTIHTNNALNTIERLTDMDVERYLIGTSLNGIISQKLARKLCPHCRIARETNDYEKSLFKKVLHKKINKIYEVNTDGCKHCFKGYKDRIAIAEVLLITDAIRTAITVSADKETMRKLVYYDGRTHTLLEDGLEKVALGETNFEEIYKLVDLENDLAVAEAFYDEIEQRLKEEAAKKAKEKKNQITAIKEQKNNNIIEILDVEAPKKEDKKLNPFTNPLPDEVPTEEPPVTPPVEEPIQPETVTEVGQTEEPNEEVDEVVDIKPEDGVDEILDIEPKEEIETFDLDETDKEVPPSNEEEIETLDLDDKDKPEEIEILDEEPKEEDKPEEKIEEVTFEPATEETLVEEPKEETKPELYDEDVILENPVDESLDSPLEPLSNQVPDNELNYDNMKVPFALDESDK